MTLEKLDKRYKTYRWIQYITFVLSIVACCVPLIVSCVKFLPMIKSAEEARSTVGIAVILSAVIALVTMRSLVSKYISKLPYTLIILIVSVGMLVGAICLKKIIDDAIAILWVAAISSAAAFVLELVSMFCKTMAEHTEEEYKEEKRKEGNNV